MNAAEQVKEILLAELKPVAKPVALKILTTVLFPIIDLKVKESATPIDDLVWAAVKQSVLDAVNKIEV